MRDEPDKLHSHSGLERELNMGKHTVLVDAVYAPMFIERGYRAPKFVHEDVKYAIVATKAFVELGGIFKNLNR